MKEKGLLTVCIVFCILFFFILLAASCLSDRKNHSDEGTMPKAYWNQEEHDQAMHKIHQPRNLFLTVSLHRGDEVFSNRAFRIYTGKQKYGSDDEFSDLSLDGNGALGQKIKYNHSFIGIELSTSLVALENGIDRLFFSWYRPGAWVKELSVDIDISHFSSHVYPSSDTGFVRCDLFFHPDWKEKKIWVSFERLFALTSTPEEHPRGLSAKEAEIIRNGQGSLSIVLHMPGFFHKWNKNYTQPWKEGDLYPVSVSLTLVPPAGFFSVKPSDKQDSPFVPKKYNGKVDSSDGDPYLFVPSTEPLEEAIIEVNISIPVTGVMVE